MVIERQRLRGLVAFGMILLWMHGSSGWANQDPPIQDPPIQDPSSTEVPAVVDTEATQQAPAAEEPPTSDETESTQEDPTTEQSSAIAEPVPLQEFHIGVSDMLGISIWRNADLKVTVPVAPDGMISLPLVGDVLAAGRTPAEVRADLSERYGEFLTAPEVSLVVTQINSRVFYIIGEVRGQGVYALLLPTTIMQALARAGGLSDFAKKDSIVILRRIDDVEQYMTVSIKTVQSGKRLEDNILLKPGDTIIVP